MCQACATACRKANSAQTPQTTLLLSKEWHTAFLTCYSENSYVFSPYTVARDGRRSSRSGAGSPLPLEYAAQTSRERRYPMATAADWKKRRARGEFSAEQALGEEPGLEQAAPRPQRRRWRWKWLLAGVLVLVVLVWLLPSIVAHSPLLNLILGSVAADLKGKVTARSATLGWLSSLRLSGLEICDEQGQPLLEVPEIRGDRSLLAILWD